MTFHDPSVWWLMSLALLPVIWWRWMSGGRRRGVRYSSVTILRGQGRSLRTRLRCLIPLLRTLAIALLIVCLARPQKGNEETRIFAEGIAVQMLVDLSGRLEALDFQIDGKRANRLEAIKKVSREFIQGTGGGGGDLPGRPDDLIGLVVFGTYADSLAPLTLDHDMALALLDRCETYGSVARQREMMELQREGRRLERSDPARARSLLAEAERLQGEGGTAIGDAIALGVERLQALRRDRRRVAPSGALGGGAGGGGGGEGEIKSNVMILLTDGAQTAGDLSPVEGARLAARYDIKVYTVGVGTPDQFLIPSVDQFGEVRYEAPGGRFGMASYANYRLDEATLQEVARLTGGRYFYAKDTGSLRSIYAEIDELEKTRTQERRYMQYKDLATETTVLGSVTVPPLLLIVLGLLALETLLRHTVLRSVP